MPGADRSQGGRLKGFEGDVWAALASPRAYPEDAGAAGGVEWIQTHLSHVYRTAGRVYKFRKPVDLGFVRFDSLRERNADCLREVALNRRLAPDVYLGVAPLDSEASWPRVGLCRQTLAGDDVEHCVVMRRLPEGRDALSLLEAGRLLPEHLDALAQRLARFHAEVGLGAPAPFSSEEWLAHCTKPVADNFAVLAGAAPEVVAPEAVALARARSESFAAERRADFERRRVAGRVVDGHGDLHLQHVYYERDGARPIAIDALEFSADLRHIDAASELAFPAMDLRYRGARGFAERLLGRYAAESDDFDLYALVDWFTAYRAGVRAKVAALAVRDPAIEAAQRERAAESAVRHLELAAEALAPAPVGRLVLVGGLVGSGKSSAAACLADGWGGVVVASDRVRKRLLGVAPTERVASGWKQGAYSEAWTDRTYAALCERAAPVLASGRTAILDATWSRERHRHEAIGFARKAGADVLLVEARCEPDLARERLARRAQAGNDPSDAGPEALASSAAAFEAIRAGAVPRVIADTGRSGWRKALVDEVMEHFAAGP